MSKLQRARDDMLSREAKARTELQNASEALRSFQEVDPGDNDDYAVYALRCRQKPNITAKLEEVRWDDPDHHPNDVKQQYNSLSEVPKEALEDGGWHRTRAVRVAGIDWVPLWAALAANAETVFHVGLAADVSVRLAKHLSPQTESSTFHQLVDPIEPVVLYSGLSREEARNGEIYLTGIDQYRDDAWISGP